MSSSLGYHLQQKQTQTQSQTLALTPQLLQGIRLLQYNQLELADYIHTQMEQNPLLEWREDSLETGTEQADIALDKASLQEKQSDLTGEEGYHNSAEDIAGQLDSETEYLFPESTSISDNMSYSSFQSHNGFESDFSTVENMKQEEVSLQNHLQKQLGLFDLTFIQKKICAHLIELLSPAGYLEQDNINIIEKLGASEADFEKALEALQNMEPTGVGARDLKECLTLQLKELNHFDPWMDGLLDNLDLLAKHDIAILQKKLNINHNDLIDMIKEIKMLNPKPGLNFEYAPVAIARPDVKISQDKEGGYKVELLSDALPKILVNERYHATLSATLKKEEDQQFLNEKLQEANWLMRNLDQRARTILKVSSEILRYQHDFFMLGIDYLKPMKLTDIAQNVEMHESTISRVTSNKYIETPRGIFEMRYFFSNAVGGGGDNHEQKSAQTVKHAIKRLIEKEDQYSILSDDAIVALLQKEGIEIARRTVAKYREALHIPSSSQRRRLKKAAMAG